MNLSLIICTHNNCAGLSTTLQSCRNLQIPSEIKWELIVVDNNSDDGTRNLCQVFQSHLPLRYTFEPHQGLSIARNRGIQEARGTLIAFTDDDVDPDYLWIATLLAAATRHPSAMYFGGKVVPQWEIPPPPWLEQTSPTLLRAMTMNWNLGDNERSFERKGDGPVGANMAFRAEVFRSGEIFRVDLGAGSGAGGDDAEFFARLQNRKERGVYVPSAVVYHRNPRHRMTEKYLRNYSWRMGRADVRLREVVMNHLWFDVPRHVWKKFFVNTVKFLLYRWTCPAPKWVAAEQQMAHCWGVIQELHHGARVRGQCLATSHLLNINALLHAAPTVDGTIDSSFRGHENEGFIRRRRSLKVCIVTPAFTRANSTACTGTETYTETLAKGLLMKGAEVHVLLYSDRALEKSLPAIPVHMHFFQMKRFSYFSNFFPGLTEGWSISRFLIQLDQIEHFDVIEGMNDEGRMLFVGRTFRNRFWMRFLSSLRQHIATKKQNMNWKRRFSVWLDGQAARRAANWVTHSRYHAAELAREYRIPVDKIHLVPLAVEELKQPMTAAPKPTSPHPTIAYIGTLDQRKGIDVFLRAIPGISRDEPGSQFLIIGHDGGDSPSISWREWFADEYKDATLLSKVEFTGFVPDDQMLKLWNRIDVVVVPSRYESFGLVVVEAYLHCIPVIISDGGALPEVAGDAALIFASGHADDLAERVLTVLQQPNRAEDLAARGHRRFDEKYTLDRFAENIVNLYKVVL